MFHCRPGNPGPTGRRHRVGDQVSPRDLSILMFLNKTSSAASGEGDSCEGLRDSREGSAL